MLQDHYGILAMIFPPRNPSRRCRISRSLFTLVLIGVLCSIGLGDPNSRASTEENAHRNASELAYHLFHLVLAADHDEPKQEDLDPIAVVFKDGNVQRSWLPISQGGNELDPTSLFHHDEYTDRISFDFSFASLMNYDIRSPTCSSSNDKIAKPKVIDFETDVDQHAGSFSIVYDCRRHPAADEGQNITVSVVLPVVPGLSLFYSFRKTCGGGTHKYIEIGHFQESEQGASDVSRVPFPEKQRALTIGPHLMSTKVYIHLHKPATYQEFFHVTVNSSSDTLGLTTRGPTFGGVLRESESAVIHILYECHGSGEFYVSVRVPIFPFRDLTATWKKDCGGGLAEGLSVGTSLSDKNDIVAEAKTTEKWCLALQTISTAISDKAPVVNASIRIKDFWLSNDGIPIRVAPAVITVEDPGVLTVLSSNSDRTAALTGPNDGGLLPVHGNLRLRLRMICTRKGRSLVIVTFPIRSFSNVEFGFVKQCKAPERYVHSGFLRTANSVMTTVSLFMAAIFAYWWMLQYKNASTAHVYKPVPVLRRM